MNLRSIIIGILALMGVSCAKSEKVTNQQNDMNQGDKVLVAYFSATGTTERVAKAIAETTEGTLYEIVPQPRYTAADLNWNDRQSRSSVEMNDPECRPQIGGETIDASEYDVIFIGYPIWWDLAPRQVNSWIESQHLDGKRVIPFATSGGSTIDGSVRDLRRLYPNINWEKGRLLNSGAPAASSWATQMIK